MDEKKCTGCGICEQTCPFGAIKIVEKIAIIGDIAHSRVAHSDIIGFTKMGASVAVSGPATMVPIEVERLGAKVCLQPQDAVADADVVMALRIQRERLREPLIPSSRSGCRPRTGMAKPDALIMHPGPINRGVEIDPAISDGPNSVILDQVTNGVAVRMALLYLLMGGE